MADYDKVELRSEKVQNLLGKVPPGLVREGIGVIVVILLLMGLAVFYIPYPENIKVNIKVTSMDEWNTYVEAFIPYRFIEKVKKEMPVEIEFEGYEANKYGFVKATIQVLNDTIVSIDGQNYFCAGLSVKSGRTYRIQEKMNGVAFILISDKSIIEHILNK